MKFFICFIVIVILEVNCLPAETSNDVPTWRWEDIKPDDVVVKPVEPQPKAHPKREPKSRIYNGRETTPNETEKYKFQVRLVAHKRNKKDNKEGLFGCGGTIISANTVLTAAHCVEDCYLMELYFGVRDVKDIESGIIQSQKVDSSAFKKPKTWINLSLIDDIALILLPEAIHFSDNVGPAALPHATDKCPEYTGNHMDIFGWGRTNDSGDRADILKTSNVDVADGEICTKVFDWLFNPVKMICADGSKHTGTCKGDSGGPLIITENGEPVVTGVVSYGTNNCVTNEPRVFTCVAFHMTWIKATMI